MVNNKLFKEIRNYALIIAAIIITFQAIRTLELKHEVEKLRALSGNLTKISDSLSLSLDDYHYMESNRIQDINKFELLVDSINLLSEREKNLATTTKRIVITERVTSEEIRGYDSLQFALAKAKAQVENMRKQLKNKSYGEYLTFKSKKGNEMHYVGQVKNSMANGRGVALLNTGSRYEGEWKDNERHGEGVFYWVDGQYYKGGYRKDQRHGLGTYHWLNGDKFIGEWSNDQRNGQGTFYNKNGEVVASGFWENNELVEVEKGK